MREDVQFIHTYEYVSSYPHHIGGLAIILFIAAINSARVTTIKTSVAHLITKYVFSSAIK